jgi:hypothetical protein
MMQRSLAIADTHERPKVAPHWCKERKQTIGRLECSYFDSIGTQLQRGESCEVAEGLNGGDFVDCAIQVLKLGRLHEF